MKSTRFIGALVAAIVLVLALAACDSGGAGTTSSKSNADLLKEAAANMKAAKSYHVDLTANQAGQDVKMAGDIDVTNNKTKLDMSAQGQSISMVSIGSDNYISMDGGKTYTKSPTSAASGLDSFTKMWDSFKPEEIDKVKDAIKDGTPKDEKVGTDDTRHMTGSQKDLAALSPSSNTTATDGTIDIWVTTGSTPTVRKLQVKSADSNATVEWSNINQSVTIDAPPTTP
jgi:hypothetical protein